MSETRTLDAFRHAYRRLSIHLLGAFQTIPGVSEFQSDILGDEIAVGTESSDVLNALGVQTSLVVPAFPLEAFPTKHNQHAADPSPVYFARRDPARRRYELADDSWQIDSEWQDLRQPSRMGSSTTSPAIIIVAGPRGLTSRVRTKKSSPPKDIVDYFSNQCSWTLRVGDHQETWQQLCLKPQGDDYGVSDRARSLSQLRRGMPASPTITYFRFRRVHVETGTVVSSAVVRSVIVRDTHWRSWKASDGVEHFPPLQGVLAPWLFDENVPQVVARSSNSPGELEQVAGQAGTRQAVEHEVISAQTEEVLPGVRDLFPDLFHSSTQHALTHRERWIYGQDWANGII